MCRICYMLWATGCIELIMNSYPDQGVEAILVVVLRMISHIGENPGYKVRRGVVW